jgi:hypothetical protein
MEEHRQLASQFIIDLDPPMLCPVHVVDDKGGKTFDTASNKVYLVGKNGNIACPGG